MLQLRFPTRLLAAATLTFLATSPASLAQGTYTEDFEGFSVGALAGQGGWSTQGAGSPEIVPTGIAGFGAQSLRFTPGAVGTGGNSEVLRSPQALGGQEGKLFFDCVITGTDREFSFALLDLALPSNGGTSNFLFVRFRPDGLITVLKNVGSTLSSFALASDTWTVNVPMRIGLELFGSTSRVRVWKDGTPIYEGAPYAPFANYPDSMDSFAVYSSFSPSGSNATLLLDNFENQECVMPTSYCSSLPNSSGQSALLSMNGSVSIADNDLSYSVFQAAPSSFGLLFYGSQQIQLPLGEGLRCVGGGGQGVFRVGPVQPLTPANLPFSSGGSAFVDLDLTQPVFTTGNGQITPGSTWNFQFVFRDQTAQGNATLNSTQGVQVTFCP